VYGGIDRWEFERHATDLVAAAQEAFEGARHAVAAMQQCHCERKFVRRNSTLFFLVPFSTKFPITKNKLCPNGLWETHTKRYDLFVKNQVGGVFQLPAFLKAGLNCINFTSHASRRAHLRQGLQHCAPFCYCMTPWCRKG